MVKITVDSTADLGFLYQREGIEQMPLNVTLKERTYLDGVSINAETVFKYYDEHKILPKTAARGVQEYKDFFARVKGDGDLIHFCMTSELGGSYASACLAANEMQGVYVIDSRTLSSGIGLQALEALDMARAGKTKDEILEALKRIIPRTRVFCFVSNMVFLHAGGRCSTLTKLVASVLKIKPVIEVKNGCTTVGQKFIGGFDKTILKGVDAVLKQYKNPDLKRIAISYADVPPAVLRSIENKIKELRPDFKEILTLQAGCTIACHTGRCSVGICLIGD